MQFNCLCGVCGDDIIFSCSFNLRNGMLLYYLDGMNNWTNGLYVPNALIRWFHTHKTNNYMFMKVLLSIIFQVLRGQIWQLILVLHRWELKRRKDFASLFNKFTRNLYVYFPSMTRCSSCSIFYFMFANAIKFVYQLCPGTWRTEFGCCKEIY